MTETKEILETRRNFYAFLYRMYLEEPPRELADDLVKGKISFSDLIPLDEELSEGFRRLNEFMEKSKGKAADELHEELVDEYTRLFVGPHRLPVQPYESWWVDGKLMGKSLLTVKRDYRKAGIVKARDYAEPEDHIAFWLFHEEPCSGPCRWQNTLHSLYISQSHSGIYMSSSFTLPPIPDIPYTGMLSSLACSLIYRIHPL